MSLYAMLQKNITGKYFNFQYVDVCWKADV